MQGKIEVNLDDLADDVRDKVSAAILEQITEEKRDALITAAITHLTTPAEEGYRRGKSPIEAAFIDGVERVAREIAEEAVKDNREKIVEITKKAVEKALNSEEAIDKIEKALTSMWGRGY